MISYFYSFVRKGNMSVIWITGLSGAGKTTLAKGIIRNLAENNNKTPILIDGDDIRQVLNSSKTNQSQFGRNERIELAFKYSRLSKLFSEQGHLVIVATISLFQEIHEWNKHNISDYFEIYLKVSLDILRERDTKNIYKMFDAGTIKNVSGLDLDIDEPKKPDLVLDSESTFDYNLKRVMNLISVNHL